MDMPNIIIGKRLRELRTARDIPQKELALAIGVGRSTIAEWESGNRSPLRSNLQAIAEFFDVSVDYLLGYTTIPKPERSLFNREPPNAESIFNKEPSNAKKNREAFEELLHKLSNKNSPKLVGNPIQEQYPLEPHLHRLLNALEGLSPEQIDYITNFILSIKELHSGNREPVAMVAESKTGYLVEPLAAHRDDNPMDDLPQEALDNIEEFKRSYLQDLEDDRRKGKKNR